MDANVVADANTNVNSNGDIIEDPNLDFAGFD